MGEAAAEGDGSMGEAAKAHRPEMHTGQSVGWPTAATAAPKSVTVRRGSAHKAGQRQGQREMGVWEYGFKCLIAFFCALFLCIAPVVGFY